MKTQTESIFYLEAERLTLAVLFCGIAALALSDFVSSFYWLLAVTAGLLRLWLGPSMALKELQASLVGWVGFAWVCIELALGRDFLVSLTDFLLILALAVIVEEATPRNYLHRMLVSGFLILAAAVLTDSVLYVLPLMAFLLMLWRATQRLYGLQHFGEALPLSGWTADIRMSLIMVGMSALLFFFLPRFEFHSMLRSTQPRMETSGFSGNVQFGDFARTLDPTVVLRVESTHPEDAKLFRNLIQGRYWRGVALDRFTGDGWEPMPRRIIESWHKGTSILRGNRGLEISVYRDATDHPVVMLPDGWKSVRNLPAGMNLDDEGSLRFDSPPSHRVRLLMTVSTARSVGVGMRPPMPIDRNTSSVPPEVARWAKKTAGSGSDADKVKRLVTELRGWTYDLHVRINPKRPMQSFLRQRRGYCELYATLLALSLRSLGIPARVVDGYFGGDWDKIGHFLLIRQSQAHSWVEAWINGRWQREDGTPASRWALSGVRFPELDAVWETVKLGWYSYVLEFQDADRSRLFGSFREWLKTQLPIIASLLAISVIGIWGARQFKKYRRRPKRPSWPLLDAWMSKRGWHRPIFAPLRTAPVPQGIPPEQWKHFVEAWEAQVYGTSKPWRRKELHRNLRALSKAHW